MKYLDREMLHGNTETLVLAILAYGKSHGYQVRKELAQRQMEVEAIFGNPLRAAQTAGAKSPLIETLYRQLKFLDERNRSPQ